MSLHKITIYLLTVLPFTFIACTDSSQTESSTPQVNTLSPVDLVYPQLDTENSRWFLFSSASRPFGMVNLSPDTKLNGTWGSGYRYEVDTIKGFSHIHAWQLSGLSVMPLTTTLKNKDAIFKDFYSKFSHDTEEISPGYHSLVLDRYNIKAELTSTTRVGMHRYTFPSNGDRSILFNLNAILGPCKTQDGTLMQIDKNTLSGEFVIAPTERRPKPNPVFFQVSLNTPITALYQDKTTGNYRIDLERKNQPVLMKIGLSYTSLENAKVNLETELSHWDFDLLVNDSKSQWNDLLGRITVEGGTEKDKRRFYTDLWHSLHGRKIINDVNGAYPDNTGKEFRIGQLPLKGNGKPLFNHYNSDSFWGAQWTINTLWGLVYPEIKKEFVHSLLQYGKDGGLIPRGPSGGNYTYVMTGATCTPFIVSAIQQGIIKDDLNSIYVSLRKNHVAGGIMEKSGYEHYTNFGGGLNDYMTKGYVPHPNPKGKFGGHQDGASLTMEYAYQDYVLAQLAKKIGATQDHDYFIERSANYKNVFDQESGWMRPRNVDGIWQTDFDPYQYEHGFNESNGAQSTWFVPHDLNGLAQLMGGQEKAVIKLNEQFITSEKLNFTAGSSHEREMHPEYSRVPINYGNQPAMQTANIFGELGRPDLAQYWSRKIVKAVFSGLSPATGYNGDEDQGLMGSLNVLMKIGIFQMNGGVEDNPSYQIGSPIFDKITINLNPEYYSGETFIITAHNNSDENVLIEKATFNNNPVTNFSLSHKEITGGGHLELKMIAKTAIE